MRKIILRHDDDSPGLLIQPVHNPRSQGIAARGKRLPPAEKSIYHRAARVSCACMNGHPGGLVDHNHVRVLVENIERNYLGFGLQWRTRLRIDCNLLAGVQAKIGRASCRESVDIWA